MSFLSRKGASDGQAYKTVQMTETNASKDNATAPAAEVATIEAPKAKVVDTPKGLSIFELFRVLRPFFWPDEGSDGAALNRFRAMSTWVMVIASKLCSLYSPFFLASATNYAVEGKWLAAATDVISFCVLRFASSLFRELQSIIYLKVKQQASIELAQLTFKHVHMLSLHWHLTKETGSVIKSMDRGAEAANTLVSYLFLFLVPAFAECLAVVILFFIQFKQWGIGLIVLAGVILYAIVTIVITQWRKKFREATNKHDNEYHAKATDSIINFETVKYFTAEEFELKRFSTSVIKYQQYNVNTQYSLSILNLSQQFILYGTLLGAMILSTKAVVNGNMTIGGWVAVQSWIATIFVPLNFLGTVYSMIVQSLVDIRNLSELLNESPDIQDLPGAKSIMDDVKASKETNGVGIELENVSFHYPAGQKETSGLQDVNFKVPAGKTVALVGSTGAGKTTISRLLFRFYDPIKGKVMINGRNISHYTQKSIREMIGVVPQDTVLFNDTIMYNIRYGRREATDEEVYAAAESAQIKTFVEGLPDKWNTVVGERGLKLSGGEKQRVAIARCLLKNPPIVLLDEATSALDTITEHSIQEALSILGKNRTVIVIAHRLSTIRNADSIVVLDKGKVLENGPHNELVAIKDGSYAKLWNMQQTGVTPASQPEAGESAVASSK